MKTEYVVVPGKMRFNEKSQRNPRLLKGIEMTKGHLNTILVTGGMEFSEGKYEFEFIKRYAMGCNVRLGNAVDADLVRMMSDNGRENLWDEISYFCGYLIRECSPLKNSLKVTFVTEGRFHALCVKIYALLPLQTYPIEVVCVDSGERLTWRRRLQEIYSTLKFFRWLIRDNRWSS